LIFLNYKTAKLKGRRYNRKKILAQKLALSFDDLQQKIFFKELSFRYKIKKKFFLLPFKKKKIFLLRR